MLTRAALFLCLSTSFAVGGEEEKRNVLHHAAQALAIQILCPHLKANESLIIIALALHGVDPEADDAERRILADAEDIVRSTKDLDRDTICALGLSLYGPGGTNVPDFIARR
jgi:hypothetical protein